MNEQQPARTFILPPIEYVYIERWFEKEADVVDEFGIPAIAIRVPVIGTVTRHLSAIRKELQKLVDLNEDMDVELAMYRTKCVELIAQLPEEHK